MGLLRRSVELGFGALMLTKEAAEQLLDELTEDDGLDRERAGAVVEELRQGAEQWRAQVAAALHDDFDRALEAAGLVRKSEFDRLAARVAALEAEARVHRSAALPFESTSEF